MHRLTLHSALALLSALALACAATTTAPKSTESSDEGHDDAHEVDQAAEEVASHTAAGTDATGDTRAVGDYVTFTFSGSYRKTPLLLTQRVVDKDAASLTVDFVFSDQKSKETLRVTTSHAGEILAVSRVGAGGETQPADRAAFEARIAETVAFADENEALVGEEPATLSVGGRDIEATRSTYRVRVGKKAATLQTIASASFAWGDLGGQIVTADGKVFYKAELVDAGGAGASTASLTP